MKSTELYQSVSPPGGGRDHLSPHHRQQPGDGLRELHLQPTTLRPGSDHGDCDTTGADQGEIL